MSGTAAGRWLFSRIICFKAPYFSSIRPNFDALEPGRAEAHFRKRRSVTNHIGTVHAIAMANLCELVAGTMTEVSVPANMRWIPRSMTIDYLSKAETDVRAEATLAPIREGEAQDAVVSVDVFDDAGERVVHADVTMYVSPKKV
jgi:acyl-coenzyme A thioesterase PaaI-like protein